MLDALYIFHSQIAELRLLAKAEFYVADVKIVE